MLQKRPPQSQDHNIIERVRAFWYQKIKIRNPSSKEELWRMVKEKFDAIPNDMFQDLFNSLPRRVKAAVWARAGIT